MKRFRSMFLLVASLALLALVAPVTAAHADAPSEAGGTLAYTPPTASPVITPAGQNLFIDVEIDGAISGTFDGVIHEAYTVVHHSVAEFNTYRGVLEFDGTVTDSEGVPREGTLTLLTRGRQDPGMPFPTDVPWYTSWVIVGGTGELEHVQGHGTGVLVGLTLEYSGQVHFAG